LLEDELSGGRSFVPVANPTTAGTGGTCCKEKEIILFNHLNQCSQITVKPWFIIIFVGGPEKE
jgi:hypothetical protein